MCSKLDRVVSFASGVGSARLPSWGFLQIVEQSGTVLHSSARVRCVRSCSPDVLATVMLADASVRLCADDGLLERLSDVFQNKALQEDAGGGGMLFARWWWRSP